MLKFTVEIEFVHDELRSALEDDRASEVIGVVLGRLVQKIADEGRLRDYAYVLTDVNGNVVGKALLATSEASS